MALDILSIDALAQGANFGNVGAYERVIARAHGEVDPDDPANRGIVNIDKAPRNARGRVEYHSDVYLLRPKEPSRGNGRLLYEVTNRGRKMLFGNLADGPQGVNDPHTIEELGNAFPLRQGYTLVWSGWDADAPRANGGLALDAPVVSVGGAAIVQRIRDEFVSGTRLGVLEQFRLSYEAASLDPATARLTWRERARDRPTDVPVEDWRFVDARTIRLMPEGTPPRQGVIYEFHYPAKNPKVLGLGFAATRDLVSWLRHSPDAQSATGGPIRHTFAIGISQAGRYLRDHISQGFNRDEQGRRVFDGVLSHIAGIGRVFLNTPFGQPWRTNTQHEDHDYPENIFPFSSATLHDAITGARGALLRGEDSDPLLIETNTSTEYWQKGASLLHTDTLGERDVDLPPNTRVFLIAGTQHAGRAGATRDRGPNINPRNPHNAMPAVRALLVALDDWVVSGIEPPPSQVPTLARGTLVPVERLDFPDIPGAAVARTTNRVSPPGDWVNPQISKKFYRVLVCQVDADGNEVAGIRLPDIAVPLATYTGWNAYEAPYLAGELADRDGSYLAFAPDRGTRQAAGDPRPSVAERYKDGNEYVAKVSAAADTLVRARLLLGEDAERFIAQAREMAIHHPAFAHSSNASPGGKP